MTLWLEKNDIEMYSTHNEGKSVAAKRFIRTLKIKFVSILDFKSKNLYIDKLDDILNKFNNTYHSRIKMKPVDVKPNTYIESSKGINYHDPKFKIGDIVRISKNKDIFAKGYVPNWSEDIVAIKKVKYIIPWTYVISDLKGKKLLKRFKKKACRKQKSLELKK